MKVKLNDAQARAYIAGDQSKPVQEIERKHILHLAACLREAADRPGMNLAALCKPPSTMSKTISAQKTDRS